MRCSMICVTVSSSVFADAPGYVDVTVMVGGAMLGYCAIGKRKIDSAPASMITSAITHAKMGRSMKKRTMASRPSWFGQDCGALPAALVSCCEDLSPDGAAGAVA